MSEKNKKTDSVPENFSSIEEAAEFWDTHSITDYQDDMSEVEIEVRVPRQKWVPLATSFTNQVAKRAKREGVSIETLINLWVSEKLQTSTH